MTDNKEILNCPACGKVMKKIFIQENNLNIDICVDGCGGVYFDNRELEKFDEKHKNADLILDEINDKKFISVDTKKERICPVCGATMMKQGAADGNVEIDICAFCGGKFLDYGELESIRNFIKNELDDKRVDFIINQLINSEISNVENSIKIKKLPNADKRVGFFISQVLKRMLK